MKELTDHELLNKLNGHLNSANLALEHLAERGVVFTLAIIPGIATDHVAAVRVDNKEVKAV